MIEFKDYPDITAPVNSENLNGNFNETIHYRGSILVTNDFNNYITPGIYLFGGVNAANRPSNFGNVIVLRANEFISQVCVGSSVIAFRISFDTGAYWSNWKYLTGS
jgi:hypothetical protein